MSYGSVERDVVDDVTASPSDWSSKSSHKIAVSLFALLGVVAVLALVVRSPVGNYASLSTQDSNQQQLQQLQKLIAEHRARDPSSDASGGSRVVMLMRHAAAKMSKSGKRLDDHERPLTEEGRQAAFMQGIFLGQRAVLPDLVLCSNSTRTRETLESLFEGLRATKHGRKLVESVPVTYTDSLYTATPDSMLEEIRATTQHVVLVVGHNPTIGDLAGQLVGSAHPRRLLDELRQGEFPTAAIAAISFDCGSDSAAGSGSSPPPADSTDPAPAPAAGECIAAGRGVLIDLLLPGAFPQQA